MAAATKKKGKIEKKRTIQKRKQKKNNINPSH